MEWDICFIRKWKLGQKLDGKERLWGSIVDNSQLLKPYSFIDDNVRDFYDMGTEYNNTIALSGGSDVTSFYFSYGNVTSNGVIPSIQIICKETLFRFAQIASSISLLLIAPSIMSIEK